MKLAFAARHAVVGGLAILGLMAVLTVWSVRLLLNSVERIAHWAAIQRQLDDIGNDWRVARTSLKWYFRTDESSALDEFRASFDVIESGLRDLLDEIGDDPPLRSSHKSLADETAQIGVHLKTMIDVHQTQGARERMRLNAKQSGDPASQRVTKATVELKNLVSDRQRQDAALLRARSWWAIGVIVCGCVSAAGVALFASWSVRRDLVQRRRTESQLQERESRLKAILESEPECVKQLAADGTLLEMNAAGLAMIEAESLAQVVGQCVYPLISQEHRSDFQNLVQRVFQGESGTLEFESTGLKGNRLWLETHAAPLRDVTGRVVSMLAVTRNITERQQAAEALRASEQRFRALIENSSDGIALFDGSGNLQYLSPSVIRLGGYSHAELADRNYEGILHPDDRATIANFFVALRQRPAELATIQFRCRHSNGHWIWLEAVGANRLDTSSVQALVVNFRDIAERKRADESVRTSEQRFRALIEHSSDGITIFAADGTNLYGTPSGTRMTGYEVGENYGHKFSEFIHPEDRPLVQAQFREVLAKRGTFEPTIFRYLHKNGSWVWLEAVATNLLDEPCVQGIVVNYHDITERMQAEQALSETKIRFRTIFELAPVGVALIDLTTAKVVECNEMAARQLGYSPAEFAQLEIADFEATESPEMIREHIERLLRQGHDEFETQHRTKTGEIRDVFVTIQIIELSGQTLSHCIFLDITDRKQAAASLRRSQEHLASLINTVDGIVWEVDAKSLQFTFVSPRAERLLGYPLSQWTEQPNFWVDHLHPDDREETVRFCVECTQQKRDHEIEYRMLAADGRIVWLRDIVTVVLENDQPVKLRGIMLDITERKRNELALLASEERFKSFMDHLPAVAFIKDASGRYVFGNKHWTEQIHGSNRVALGKTDFELWPSPLAELFHASDREVLLRGRSVDRQQMIERTPGVVNWFQLLKFPIQQDFGPPLVGGIALDITHIKQFEESIRHTANRLGALLETAQTLGSTLDLDSLLDQLLHRLTQVISITNRSAIYIYDPLEDVLIPKACNRDDAETYRQIRLKPGESISGKVFQTGRSVLLRSREEIEAMRGELSPENERLLAQDRTNHTVQSTIGVPLRTRLGEIIGTMTLASTRGTFTAEDLSLLEGVAAQASIAIQNAELFDEVRAGRERLQTLSRQLIANEEADRHHLARELHDEIGQLLTAVSLRLHSMKNWCGTDLRAELDSGIGLIDHAIEQVRGLSLNLRPAMLDVLGLEAAIRWCVEQQRTQTGCDVKLKLQLESRLSPDLEITCFRVVQSAITNIARHARASEAEIEILQHDLELELIVRDNGIGLNLEDVHQRSERGESFGLLAMRERVELVGGTFRIDSGSGQGTAIRAHFPLSSKTPATG